MNEDNEMDSNPIVEFTEEKIIKITDIYRNVNDRLKTIELHQVIRLIQFMGQFVSTTLIQD